MAEEEITKETFTQKILGYVIVIIILILGYGGYQYYGLRDSVQETVLEILNDNDYNNINPDGISLPYSIVFANKVNADIFLLIKGEMVIIEVEVIPKDAMPILSIFGNLEYVVSIPGPEMFKLRKYKK